MASIDGMDIIFLHGFGDINAAKGHFVRKLQHEFAGKDINLHAPSYHPDGDVSQTRLKSFLADLAAMAANTHQKKFACIFGFSVGGLIAALFQESYPNLVDRVVLLAPAIDNFARNFADVPAEQWYMPREYVEELQSLSARPRIMVPAVLIHGELENDAGGSALWRIKEWAELEPFEACFHPRGLGHSPSIVGADMSPSWSSLASWAAIGGPLHAL
eukprot:TRINITY_DN96503_c0_g1_i1.p1 TRINITY_DN96503_c0_g1~~TRINITY_DN96503_c0_g1_i1.p1  ORF type:complete len:216 (-),score=20.60 TRINITY_DN96503_c0_g1_i1:80-727(-)